MVPENDRIARSLGPDAYDPPVMPAEPHPFVVATIIGTAFFATHIDNPYCALCGAGLLHEVHGVQET